MFDPQAPRDPAGFSNKSSGKNYEHTVDGRKIPPLQGLKKGFIGITRDFSFIFPAKDRVLYNRFLAFLWGPGGFRELREAYRKHFHRSWYLLVPGVTSYDQKPSFFKPSTVRKRTDALGKHTVLTAYQDEKDESS